MNRHAKAALAAFGSAALLIGALMAGHAKGQRDAAALALQDRREAELEARTVSVRCGAFDVVIIGHDSASGDDAWHAAREYWDSPHGCSEVQRGSL